MRRHATLSAGWHFSCNCHRCLDGSECGTELGSFLCSGLAGAGAGECPGAVRPTSPLGGTDYRCAECGAVYPGAGVAAVAGEWRVRLEEAGRAGEPVLLQDELARAGGLLHPGHAILLAAGRNLVWRIGHKPDLCTHQLLTSKVRSHKSTDKCTKNRLLLKCCWAGRALQAAAGSLHSPAARPHKGARHGALPALDDGNSGRNIAHPPHHLFSLAIRNWHWRDVKLSGSAAGRAAGHAGGAVAGGGRLSGLGAARHHRVRPGRQDPAPLAVHTTYKLVIL